MATFEWTGGAVEVPVGCYVAPDGVLHATEKADKVGTPLSTVDGDTRRCRLGGVCGGPLGKPGNAVGTGIIMCCSSMLLIAPDPPDFSEWCQRTPLVHHASLADNQHLIHAAHLPGE